MLKQLCPKCGSSKLNPLIPLMGVVHTYPTFICKDCGGEWQKFELKRVIEDE